MYFRNDKSWSVRFKIAATNFVLYNSSINKTGDYGSIDVTTFAVSIELCFTVLEITIKRNNTLFL